MNYLRLFEDPGWNQDARTWICEALGLGDNSCPPLQPVRIMPWAAVYRIDAEPGPVFFKACADTQGHEPALVDYLARRHPACSLPVLAADLERRWLLLGDGGRALGQMQLGQEALFAAWTEVLALAAKLQRAAETDIDELAQMGVPRKGLDDLLAVYSRLMDEPWRLRAGDPAGVAVSEVEPMRRMGDRLERAFAELAAVGVPDSLVHEEPHDRHIFVREENGPGRYVFYDWGDACIGQPFMWPALPLRDMAEDFPEALTPRAWDDLSSVYLRPWLDIAPLPVLQRVLPVGMVAACVARAQTWMLVEDVYGQDVPQLVLDFYPRAMAYWLRRVRDWLTRYEAGLPPLP